MTETASAEVMRVANSFLIPRNQRIEELAHQSRRLARGFTPFETLVRASLEPFDEHPELAHLAEAPAPHARVQRTFCGT